MVELFVLFVSCIYFGNFVFSIFWFNLIVVVVVFILIFLFMGLLLVC